MQIINNLKKIIGGVEYSIEINIIILIVTILLIIAAIITLLKKGKIELSEKELEIKNLKEYNKTLLTINDSLRIFKHNFSNFIQALEGYIITDDMAGIKEMCNSLYKEYKTVNELECLSPTLINNPAIYSIVTNKYNLAHEKNVEMNIEVMIDFQKLDTNMYELSNILGILLDNAIEAADESTQKIVNVKFINDLKTNNKLIIIENTYKDINLDIEKIFEKGYSTKKKDKEDRGLGLWNVKKTLAHESGMNLYTSQGKFFIQKLEICDTKSKIKM